MDAAGGRRMGWVVGAVAIVALLALLFWPDRGEPAADLEEEPQVEVVQEDGSTQSMGIEAYVAGVVAGEMEPDWPKTAYAAQALVARTFAVQYLSKREGNRISGDFEEAQAFQPDRVTNAIRDAVEETRGQVITYDGEPIQAWFHAYAGGETASAREGLVLQEEEPPYIEPVELPDNRYVPEEYRHWTLTLPLSEVQQALAVEGREVGDIQEITAERGPTGRITRVEIRGSGAPVIMTGPEFRAALDPERMKSAKVSRLDIEGGNLSMEGTGYGHGVGLSQWDALLLAEEGKSAEEIIQTFYRDVKIERRWK